MLLNNYSFAEIEKETGVSFPHISNINQGKRRRREWLDYSLRTDKVGVKGSKLTTKDIEEIVELIKTSDLSLTSIGKQYDVSQSMVSEIKSGRRRKLPHKTYPLKRQ